MKFRLGCGGRVSVCYGEIWATAAQYTGMGKLHSCEHLLRAETYKPELSPEERLKSHLAAGGDVPAGEGGAGEWHHANPCLPAGCLETKLPASPGSPKLFAYKRIGNWGFVGKPKASAMQSAGGDYCRYGAF